MYLNWRDDLVLLNMAVRLRKLPLNTIDYKINGVGPDSSVGLATLRTRRSAIESRWGSDFPHPSVPVVGLT
jgi:hypothetical protein